MEFHPAAQILSWCLLVVALQKLTIGVLLLATLIVMLFALFVATRKLMQLLRRTRWIMLSLMMVYAYSTPGQAWMGSLGAFSPTSEGLHDGSVQLLRLLMALAGLAILLTRLPRQQLIAGIYALIIPLGWLGLSRERLAVRLALTLQYAEVAMLRRQKWQDTLSSLFQSHQEPAQQVVLTQRHFSLADISLLVVTILIIWLALP